MSGDQPTRVDVKAEIAKTVKALRDLGFELQLVHLDAEDLEHFSLELARIGLAVTRLQLRVAKAAAEVLP